MTTSGVAEARKTTWQAGLCVVGEGGLSEEPARVGGVARGGELAKVAAVPMCFYTLINFFNDLFSSK